MGSKKHGRLELRRLLHTSTSTSNHSSQALQVGGGHLRFDASAKRWSPKKLWHGIPKGRVETTAAAAAAAAAAISRRTGRKLNLVCTSGRRLEKERICLNPQSWKKGAKERKPHACVEF